MVVKMFAMFRLYIEYTVNLLGKPAMHTAKCYTQNKKLNLFL